MCDPIENGCNLRWDRAKLTCVYERQVRSEGTAATGNGGSAAHYMYPNAVLASGLLALVSPSTWRSVVTKLSAPPIVHWRFWCCWVVIVFLC